MKLKPGGATFPSSEPSPFPSRLWSCNWPNYLKDKHEPNRNIGRLGRLTQDSLQDGRQWIVGAYPTAASLQEQVAQSETKTAPCGQEPQAQTSPSERS